MEKLELRQALAAARGRTGSKFAGIDQDRENFPTVRARALLPLGDELGQIVLELGNRIDARIELLALEDWLERAEDRERPLTQRAPFALRYTEQIADELHRDRGGKIIDQVDDA